ncbi:tyrosine-type recombinase/integrase [Actinosynnema sp. ALI-1.44]|uniref:tyrosine-type recombinase/integrase n=1 Tax=Actinosynnema sp. ALI-1.44 TaxID=1933779 RepID=UPI00192D1729|nr:tyrosine-type recombinase/integrase [Actinosynnema sp. ALI-1.44]
MDVRRNHKAPMFRDAGSLMVRYGKANRGGPPKRRLSPRSINTAFTVARDEAGLDPALDLHCLRRSFVTHLIEFDYPERFVQEQVGHSHAATTAIYSGVSNEYRNKLMTSSMRARLGRDWDGGS